MIFQDKQQHRKTQTFILCDPLPWAIAVMQYVGQGVDKYQEWHITGIVSNHHFTDA